MYIINKKYLSNAGKIKYKCWCEKQIHSYNWFDDISSIFWYCGMLKFYNIVTNKYFPRNATYFPKND